jgi:hypothetical protein
VDSTAAPTTATIRVIRTRRRQRRGISNIVSARTAPNPAFPLEPATNLLPRRAVGSTPGRAPIRQVDRTAFDVHKEDKTLAAGVLATPTGVGLGDWQARADTARACRQLRAAEGDVPSKQLLFDAAVGVKMRPG